MRTSEAIQQFIAARMSAGAAGNTIAAYRYDLEMLARATGDRSVAEITAGEISAFLTAASAPATRKRRLTSIRALFRWALAEGHVQTDPSAAFTQVRFEQSPSVHLSEDEEIALVFASANDAAWSELAIHLMLHYGLTRNDLLLLRPGDIRETAAGTAIQIVDDARPLSPVNRTLSVSPYLLDLYSAYRERVPAGERIFTIGPPAINGMVDRVRRRAGIPHKISPRTLRDTCTINLAINGLGATEILAYLGMVDESRNRQTMQRLIDRYVLFQESPSRAN